MQAFVAMDKLKGGFGFIEGYPSCGKTSTLAALARYYQKAGLHVLLVGPSNAAVDARTAESTALDGDADYVRVRQAAVERGSRAKTHAAKDDDEKQPDDADRLAIVRIFAELKNRAFQKLRGTLTIAFLPTSSSSRPTLKLNSWSTLRNPAKIPDQMSPTLRRPNLSSWTPSWWSGSISTSPNSEGQKRHLEKWKSN